MYAMAKDAEVINCQYNRPIKADLSQIFKIVRTEGCKPGHYALFEKDDNDTTKFSKFCGYVDYNTICNSFVMIKWRS